MRSFLLLCLMVFLFAGSRAFAQGRIGPDSLFQLARKAAFDEKDYTKARAYLYSGLEQSPNYNDLRIFLGRLYAWDKNYDSARYHFERVFANDPNNADNLIAYTDMEYWANNYSKALDLAQRGYATGKNNTEFLLRKARILSARNISDSSVRSTLRLLNALPNKTAQIRSNIERLNELAALNNIGISYDYLHFQNQFPDPWHLVALQYGRRTKIGSVTGRVNYANRFGKSGYQYEVDAYPRFSKTFYSYMSAGYSNDVGVFPAWRAGFSLYANLPAAWEAEAGFRYLYFSDPTFVYTLYAGKYVGNYLLGARTYLTPSKGNISQSYNILARYYYGGASDYVGLTLGTGISPDERSQINQLNSVYKLKSYRASFVFKKSFNGKHIFDMNVGLNNQEYAASKKDNQLQAGIGYQYRF